MKLIKKSMLLLALLVVTSANLQANVTATFTSNTDAFLKENVSRGFVKYKKIKEKPEKLNKLVDQIATINSSELSGNEQKAFLINAYNVLVIKGIVDTFPVKSPTNVKGFFDVQKYTVAGNKVSLNQLEKELLYKKFPDPRLHFALVCAAIGCPQLSSNAYQADFLDKQLDMQSRKTLNNPRFIKAGKDKILVSEIFKWYEKDFVTEDKTILDFINSYRAIDVDTETEVDYYEYNWQLNAAKTLKDRDGIKEKKEAPVEPANE